MIVSHNSSLSFFSFWHFHQAYVTFCIYPTVLGYSALFFFPVFIHLFLFLALQLWRFLLLFLQFRDSQSPNKPIKGIFFHFYYTFFNLQNFFFFSFLGFPSLCLHCPSVLAHCLLFQQSPSYIKHSLMPFLIIPISLSYLSPVLVLALFLQCFYPCFLPCPLIFVESPK